MDSSRDLIGIPRFLMSPSNLMRGRIDLFSIDTLVDMLARLGVRVKLVVQPQRKRATVA